jgi:hypothetical protein
MTLYFGIPVCLREAFRIFRQDIEFVEQKCLNKLNIKKDTNYYIDNILLNEINEYLKTNTTIQVFPTDKGQYIIGYEIEEPSNVWSKFINVDNFVIKVMNLKNKFSEEMCILNANLNEVTLEYMECSKKDQIKVKNPIPYIICYH